MVATATATKEQELGKKLYVGNLAFAANETDLQELFAQAGEIVEDLIELRPVINPRPQAREMRIG